MVNIPRYLEVYTHKYFLKYIFFNIYGFFLIQVNYELANKKLNPN